MEMNASTLAMQESNGSEPPHSAGPVSAYTTNEQLANTLKEFKALSNAKSGNTPSEPEPVVQASEEKQETQPGPSTAESDSNNKEEAKGGEPSSPAEATRFNRMAKRERDLRQREAALTARLARLKDGDIPQVEKADKTEAKSQVNEVDRLKAMAKDNPLELLQEFGLTYTDIADKLIDDPDPARYAKAKEKKPEPSSDVEDRIKVLEARLQEQSRAADQSAYETAMGNLLDEIENFVSNGDGKYALIEAKGDYPMVAEVMQRHYHQNNETLSYEAAAQRVEDYLSDQLKQFVGNKKVAELLNLTAETTPVQQEVAVEATGQKKTLTRDQATSPQKSSAEERPENLSRDASLAWLAKNMDLYA